MVNKYITIKDMVRLSEKLYNKHRHKWMKATPESNIYWIAWLIGEIGEVIDVIKKKGVEKIMGNKDTRQEMLEEIIDCYMYLADILNRYKYTPEEFTKKYFEKMHFNLKRDYKKSKTKNDKEFAAKEENQL